MLQDRLRSLSNVDIKTSAKTTEVVGENHVTGIRYEDMSTGEEHLLNLDGIFCSNWFTSKHIMVKRCC